MPAFLYFLPDDPSQPRQQPTLKVCQQLGLGYALEREPAVNRVENVFGQHGFIVADPDRVDVGRIAFHGEQQTWQRWTTPAGNAVYVGMYKDQPPTPGSLQRRTMLEGTILELADEHRWLVPIARQWELRETGIEPKTLLPRVIGLTESGDGYVLGDVLPRYAPLWQIAVRYYECHMKLAEAEAQRAFFNAGGFDHAATVLSANYLVGPAECGLLKLFTGELVDLVLDTLIQLPTLVSLIQKKIQAEKLAAEAAAGSAATAISASSSGPAAAAATATSPR